VAVAEGHDPTAELGHLGLVGDQYDGGAFAVEPLEDRHDFDAGPAIEGARRLVGQDQAWPVDQRSRYGDALLLTA